MESVTYIDPSDDLTSLIRTICAKKDAAREQYSADDVLLEITEHHADAIAVRGKALAVKQTRRLIALYLRAQSGDEDSDEEFRQLKLPGIAEKLPSHISYRVPDATAKGGQKVVTRHILDATLDQHKASLDLAHSNTLRCIAKEQMRQRVIDLLEAESCNTIRDFEERNRRDSA